MKKIFTVLFLITSLSYAATGWFEDYVIFSTSYYWIGSNPNFGTQFDGHDFGVVTSLSINGADMKYWSDNQDRTGGAFYYMIKDLSDNIIVPATEVIWSQSYLGGNNYQGTWSGNIDLLTGLSGNTTYKLHIWAKSWGSSQGDSYLNKDGNNYVATFKTDPSVPVELTTFSALVTGNNVKLNWETATEVNNYGFEIERKSILQSQKVQSNTSDIEGYKVVGFVEGHGTSNSPKVYSYSDKLTTSGKYLYRLKQIDIDGSFEYSEAVEIFIEAPKEFKLGQNYPNPFNPVTVIQFSLPEETNVKMAVYNAIGEKILQLLNQKISAGNHQLSFDGSKLNSGIYFYQLETDNFVQTRKMLLLK